MPQSARPSPQTRVPTRATGTEALQHGPRVVGAMQGGQLITQPRQPRAKTHLVLRSRRRSLRMRTQHDRRHLGSSRRHQPRRRPPLAPPKHRTRARPCALGCRATSSRHTRCRWCTRPALTLNQNAVGRACCGRVGRRRLFGEREVAWGCTS